ncbi:MAG: ACT domain-containing protein [Bacteroidota bacterium]
MNFEVLAEELAVCRLPPDAAVPGGILDAAFCAVTRTADELSLVLSVDQVAPGWEEVERIWRALKIQGPLDFSMVGVIARISAPLADAGIPIFVVSTFETDYLLVKNDQFEKTCALLLNAGHAISNA